MCLVPTSVYHYVMLCRDLKHCCVVSIWIIAAHFFRMNLCPFLVYALPSLEIIFSSCQMVFINLQWVQGWSLITNLFD